MKTSASRPTQSSIAARVARLPDTPIADLKRLWAQLFDVPLSTHNRSYIERRIAYRLQELEMAKAQPQLLASNKLRIDALLEQLKPAQKAGRGELVRLAPGTVLTRDFMGQTHRVVALPNGQFEYNGKPYSSLTAIACEIAGTRWSGPAFFGLRDGAKKPRKGASA
ncbi:DUF2924 domain-containing protein [Ralstonia pseudosolanacearum]|uniref:DUF2924 domain-containing protein n=1 Tax=Ralstonia solanacearum TaxID=305 RepID=A0ABY6NKF3_RALSL|nr:MULTISPECIES: DUF2924 domain-containing protein [Ralstonia]APF89039.1 hypothetical protein BCR16_19495 [Ralstonia solanacearum FJAT-1458]ARU24704.1 membrane protein [Ralstonia solanacearum]API77079.1 hypothetical protein AC251_21025 [Ralstonia pseudosolanacearum]ASL75560.1 hypothetical protein BC350_17840 [Ralstonia pseudosolanacearum]AST88507.1 DUF2924 domain-containing protein [Ralstonia pseudosolanacearum]